MAPLRRQSATTDGQFLIFLREDTGGVLTLSIPKREEAKPKQIKVNVGAPALAAAAGAR